LSADDLNEKIHQQTQNVKKSPEVEIVQKDEMKLQEKKA
jgi:hypothetical protein